MNKFLLVLLAGLFSQNAFAGDDDLLKFLKVNKDVTQCYSSLNEKSGIDDVLSAINCLSTNPLAGEDDVKVFSDKNSQIIERIVQENTSLNDSLASLKNKKKQRLYILTKAKNGEEFLYAPDTYEIGRINFKDIFPIMSNIKMVSKQNLFSSDDSIPLDQVSSFLYNCFYDCSGGRSALPSGRITINTKDGKVLINKKYSKYWPFFIGDQNKGWGFLNIYGYAYSINYNTKQVKSKSINVGSEEIFKIINSEDAQKIIIDIENEMVEFKKINNIRNEAARVAAQRKEDASNKILSDNLNKMAKLERGAEDSCRRDLQSEFIIWPDTDIAIIYCSFGGMVKLEALSSAGWLVVNKLRNNEGIVNSYYIRKVR